MDTLPQLNVAYAKGWLTNTCKGSITCRKACLRSQDYCAEHSWCYRCSKKPKVRGGSYCYEHTCKHESCFHESLRCGLCRSHICIMPGCTGDTLPYANFCKSHRLCRINGCLNPKGQTLWWYDKACSKHKHLLCETGDCMERRKHESWCRDHYLEEKKRREREKKAAALRKQREKIHKERKRAREARRQAREKPDGYERIDGRTLPNVDLTEDGECVIS